MYASSIYKIFFLSEYEVIDLHINNNLNKSTLQFSTLMTSMSLKDTIHIKKTKRNEDKSINSKTKTNVRKSCKSIGNNQQLTAN